MAEKYRTPNHLKYLNKMVLLCLANKLEAKHLLVMMPPRHGKSEFCSHWLPAWHLLMYPSKNIILSSYSSHFAADWGRKVRATIEEFGELYGVRLDSRSTAADRFNTENGGEMISVGIGGSITGRGADLLIIDDPVKTIEEALSKNQRDKVWEWFRAVAYTRLEPNAHIILIMTRWHEDDLAGRILERDSANWNIINFPAIAGQNDLLGRSEGEALWPARFPTESLERIKTVVGSSIFSALYQQNPTPLEGEIFKAVWFDNKIRSETPSMTRVVMYCDLAASEKETADYTAIAVLGIDAESNIWILDVRRERLNWSAVKNMILSEAEMFDPIVIGVESVGIQAALVNDVASFINNYRVVGCSVKKDKVARALPFVSKCEAGKVFIRKGRFNNVLIDELIMFPRGSHDDQVDAISGAYEILMSESRVRIW